MNKFFLTYAEGSVIASLYGSVDVKRGEVDRITSGEEKAA